MTELPPPDRGPDKRDPEEVLPASSYQRGEPVWVWRHDTGWHPGEVLGGGPLAVMVSYRLTDKPGHTTDTVMPDRLAPRAKAEPGGQSP